MGNNYLPKSVFLLGIFIFTVFQNSEAAEDFINESPENSHSNKNYQEVGCGTHKLDHSLSLQIRSPHIKYEDSPSYECTWKFYGTAGCSPEITCDNFDLPDSTGCSNEFLEVFDGSYRREKFCGTNSPKVTSSSSLLSAYFKTESQDTSKGFRCNVVCVSPPQLRLPSFFPQQPPKVANCSCGVPGVSDSGNPNPTRIVNGTVAPKYKYKWQAAMVLWGDDSPLCGGSLITDRHILTAAHCVVITGLAVVPWAAEVVLNEYDITTSDETATIRRSVAVAIPHPQYSPATNDYDVAILELAPPVDITATKEPMVTPVCLPAKGNKALFVGEIGTVTGWGTTSEGGKQPDVLMEVDVPVISNEVCSKHYDNITPRMMCAGYEEGGKDSCQGDSGGPMVLAGADGRYTEIGIVSYGQGCARAGKEGVYARVTELNDWIRSNTRGATWCKD